MDIKHKEKKTRQKNWNTQEIEVLVDGCERHHEVISKTTTDGLTNSRKETAWKEITRNVNAVSQEMREISNVRKKWDDLRRETKKKYKKLEKESSGTGSGAAVTIHLSQLERRIIGLLGEARIHGIEGGKDSSAPPSTPASAAAESDNSDDNSADSINSSSLPLTSAFDASRPTDFFQVEQCDHPVGLGEDIVQYNEVFAAGSNQQVYTDRGASTSFTSLQNVEPFTNKASTSGAGVGVGLREELKVPNWKRPAATASLDDSGAPGQDEKKKKSGKETTSMSLSLLMIEEERLKIEKEMLELKKNKVSEVTVELRERVQRIEERLPQLEQLNIGGRLQRLEQAIGLGLYYS